MLSCECGDFDASDFDRWWWSPEDYSTMPERKRRARCLSCKRLIDTDAIVTVFQYLRHCSDFEYEKLGWEEAYLADRYFCEECSDIYFSLSELGFCMNIEDGSMHDALAEYRELYGKAAA